MTTIEKNIPAPALFEKHAINKAIVLWAFIVVFHTPVCAVIWWGLLIFDMFLFGGISFYSYRVEIRDKKAVFSKESFVLLLICLLIIALDYFVSYYIFYFLTGLHSWMVWFDLVYLFVHTSLLLRYMNKYKHKFL